MVRGRFYDHANRPFEAPVEFLYQENGEHFFKRVNGEIFRRNSVDYSYYLEAPLHKLKNYPKMMIGKTFILKKTGDAVHAVNYANIPAKEGIVYGLRVALINTSGECFTVMPEDLKYI